MASGEQHCLLAAADSRSDPNTRFLATLLSSGKTHGQETENANVIPNEPNRYSFWQVTRSSLLTRRDQRKGADGFSVSQ